MAECICGAWAKRTTETVVHVIGGKEIQLKNAPHYQCPSCQNIWYSIKEVKPLKHLKHALEKGLEEVDYQQELK